MSELSATNCGCGILWITVDVAVECLPAYGSFFSSAAVADGDAMATDVDVEMTAACGSCLLLCCVVDSVTDSATDAVMDADVETAVATADAAASYETRSYSFRRERRETDYIPYVLFCASPLLFVFHNAIAFSFFRKHSSSTS